MAVRPKMGPVSGRQEGARIVGASSPDDGVFVNPAFAAEGDLRSEHMRVLIDDGPWSRREVIDFKPRVAVQPHRLSDFVEPRSVGQEDPLSQTSIRTGPC